MLEFQNTSLRHLADGAHTNPYARIKFTEFLQAFNESLGSYERLKNTPFPVQYTWFVHYTLVVFLFVPARSLAGHLGYWSIAFSLVIGYAYIVLEYVGRHIEKPFENAVNDVPMDYIARSIEIDLRELDRDTELPAAIKPKGLGYLY